MKTKHDTPKYGLIYHASLVGQTSAKLKGKVSRMLAAKAALAIRVDALGEETDATLGLGQRADLERKFALLEQNAVRFYILKFFFLLNSFLFQSKRVSGTGKMQAKFEKYQKNTYVFYFEIIFDIIYIKFLNSEQGQFNQDQASTLPQKRHSDFGGRGGANKRFKSGNMNKSFVV
jgi:nucleolar protein 58